MRDWWRVGDVVYKLSMIGAGTFLVYGDVHNAELFLGVATLGLIFYALDWRIRRESR